MDPLIQAQTLAATPAGNPANVSINWTLFTGVYGAIDCGATSNNSNPARSASCRTALSE